ncbi:pumilio protein [Angomonas deanei]|uniref:Pumilio-family RNA binding repeat, putative n=1 Tax=Angomonas deanei TaxID=59799 RepID=A0A7G2CTT2_9TRYP|nr:pumilio protein [Angomonas deanei]CAD2222344.1 Pumilio-family RNA binding repeat, putative [Angomonas deanei]|eukprot:EPY18611.1 pumilio protein [Angomonas deanei]
MEELRQALKDYLDLGRPGWTYSMLEGKVAELAQEDQDSSRLVQRVMENPNYFYPILEEMLPQFDMLTKHVFANYAIQKAFEVAALASDVAEQRRKDPQAVLKGTGFSAPLTAAVVEVWVKDDPLEKMMQCVRGKVVEYSQHMYGCRAMQRALESMPEKDFDEALNEFRGKAAASVLDANANHVVQKMIELHPEKCQFMLEEFLADLVNLSCHAHGCRLLQRVFEISAKRGELEVRPLLEEVIRRLNELSIHQYGNYVVQHGLANAPADIKHRFIGLLIPQLYAFSCSKFASNVAERAVSCADEEERNSMLEEFKKSFGDATSGNYLILMMADIYANYVIQRFIDNASPDQRDALVEIVRPHLRLVSNSEYGRHLLRKMESMSLLSKEALHQCGVYDTNHTVSIANGHKSQSNGKNHNNNNNNRRGNTAAPNRGGRQNQPNHPQHHNNNAARYQNPMAPPHKSNSRYNTRSMEPQPYPYPYPMMYPPQPPMVYPMPMYNGYYPQ